MKKHILICGDVGVGKSTLIRKLILSAGKPVYGFATKRLTHEKDGFFPIYIHPADRPEEERTYSPDNYIGRCDGKIHDVKYDVFNKEGVRLIEGAKDDGLLIMDELGFMEAKAEKFVDAVFKALDGDVQIIAAVKSRRDVPFLEEVRNHPKSEVFRITKENRDQLYTELIKKLI